MFAILQDAIFCLRRWKAASPSTLLHRAKAERDYWEARAWFEAHDDRHPVSFDRICSELNLDSERIRIRLLSCGADDEVAASRLPRRPR